MGLSTSKLNNGPTNCSNFVVWISKGVSQSIQSVIGHYGMNFRDASNDSGLKSTFSNSADKNRNPLLLPSSQKLDFFLLVLDLSVIVIG